MHTKEPEILLNRFFFFLTILVVNLFLFVLGSVLMLTVMEKYFRIYMFLLIPYTGTFIFVNIKLGLREKQSEKDGAKSNANIYFLCAGLVVVLGFSILVGFIYIVASAAKAFG